MGKTVNIGGRIHNPEVGNVVAGANEILDDTKGKKQNVINSEVDTALAGLDSGKQDKLTFDQTPTESSTNPVTSGGVYAADQVLQQAIEAILLLIPSAASALNQLADKSFVNSSIATASATFRGTYNLVSDLHLSVSASHQDIATALASVVATADNNDYAFVQIPTSDTSSDIRVTERYKFNGTAWAYEYDLNNSGFTDQQWAAINSTITSALVGKLSALPTAAELATLLAGKQATLTFDSTPTPGSANPVTSGGLYDKFEAIIAKIPSDASANNKLVAENRLAAYVGGIIGALDATFDLASTDGHVTLKITQTDGLIASVQVLTSDIASAAQVSQNTSDIAALQALYNALLQSAPQIIKPTDTWPVANPSDTVIYRVIDRVNTPPEYYSDYMWNGTTMVLMAQYNNAIDEKPISGSNNLVSSGGVAEFLPKSERIYYPQYSEGWYDSVGTLHPSSDYGHVAPVLLTSYETISLNLGREGYLGEGIVSFYKSDSSGNFIEAIEITGSQDRTKIREFTNTSSTDIYIGFCSSVYRMPYILKKIKTSSSEDSVNQLKLIVENLSSVESYYSPQGTNGIRRPNGTIDTSTSYVYSEPILLKTNETIILNNGNQVYCGSDVSLLTEVTSGGEFVYSIYNTQGTNVVSYTAERDIYLSICVNNANVLPYIVSTPKKGVAKEEYVGRTFTSPILQILPGFINNNGTYVNSINAKTFILKADGIKKIRFLSKDATVTNAISFYSTNNIFKADSGYISGVANSGEWRFFEASVPSNAKLICLSHGKTFDTEDLHPVIQIERDIYSLSEKMRPQVPYEMYLNDIRYMSHTFMDNIWASPSVIPPQSLYDIKVCGRLGFKSMEFNCHSTSDGKYICMHGGGDGKIGYQLVKASVNQDTADYADTTIYDADVSINSLTFNEIRTNYLYKSTSPKMRTPVISLEEAMLECSVWGIIPQITYIDENQVSIIRSILGNRYILRNCPRSVTDGLIIDWLGNITKEDAIQYCEDRLPPYILGFGGAAKVDENGEWIYTDSELREIIDAVHERGCLLASDINYNTEEAYQRLKNLGFDVFLCGWNIPDFEDGNIYNINSDSGFSDFVYTGSIYADSVVLSSGQTIRPGVNVSVFSLAKADVYVTFKGDISITMGNNMRHLLNHPIHSDNIHTFRFSCLYYNEIPTFTITSESNNTIIYDIVAKASKC